MAKSSTKNVLSPRFRLYLLFLVFFIFGTAIAGRLFFLQIVRGDYYAALSRGQYTVYKELEPERGDIFIQGIQKQSGRRETELFQLATSRLVPMVYAVPSAIHKKEETAAALSRILNLPESEILEKIKKEDDPYEPVMKNITEDAAKEIESLALDGIGIAHEKSRFYPQGILANHLVGFLGYQDEARKGQYGVEEYYEDVLKGGSGFLQGEIDEKGRFLAALDHLLSPARDGADLLLTIDYNIQFVVEKELDAVMQKWDADGGSVIIMEPATGRILALANRPAFNPNTYNEVNDISVFLNPAIHDRYEPGSVFKPITMAAGLNEGRVSPHTTYEDPGEVKIGGYTISNFDGKAHGVKTMTEVLELSLNTGVIFVQRLLGKDLFRTYVERFGFGEKTGIDLAGEVAGDITNLSTNRDINYATATFGQGVAVTPIEMITAINAIANGGSMMRPYVVDEVIESEGKGRRTEPQVIRQGISRETASRLTAMLVSAVKNGQLKKAGISGYLVAGKSGTAQVPSEDGVGYSDKTIHSFIGYAPAFNPKFVMLLKLDNPKGIRFAADSLTLSFRKIGEYILQYYEVPPDQQ